MPITDTCKAHAYEDASYIEMTTTSFPSLFLPLSSILFLSVSFFPSVEIVEAAEGAEEEVVAAVTTTTAEELQEAQQQQEEDQDQEEECSQKKLQLLQLHKQKLLTPPSHPQARLGNRPIENPSIP